MNRLSRRPTFASRRRFPGLLTLLLALPLAGVLALPAPVTAAEKIVGMYVHQHWPYHHPYAARTWALEDWQAYSEGLRGLGFNTIMIWPVLETMPEPLTESDRANLEKISRVIDWLHDALEMRVFITLCPNVIADDAVAAQANFEDRHFFHSDLRVNPADPEAVRRMMAWREKLLRPLAKADGVSIIDSDPGGYPGSTNREFVSLLVEHRKLLDRLRPGIELLYWAHAGWPAYGRFYATGEFAVGTPEEFEEALAGLASEHPEPWSVGNAFEAARKLGLESRVLQFRYGGIEAEPSFPFTNFGGEAAYQAGAGAGPRGVMGNAQTHCLQLPNTFAFSRGAIGKPVDEADYVSFADEVLPGHGAAIVSAWKALSGSDAGAMRAASRSLDDLTKEALSKKESLPLGRLGGLILRDPPRFLEDLSVQLRVKAALEDFCGASEKGLPVREPLRAFLAEVRTWQARVGYENHWWWPRLQSALEKLGSCEIEAVLHPKLEAATPFGRVKEGLYRTETFTPRLIEAMAAALAKMP